MQDGLRAFVSLLPEPKTGNMFFVSYNLIYSGILPIAVTFLGFLPQLLILFACMEMSRHFRMPNGLSGLMLGFGCTTVAVSSLDKKTTEAQKAKILLLSFIPCAAKIPVLLVFVTGFFEFSFYIIYLLYLMTICVGVLVFLIFCLVKKINLKKFFTNLSNSCTKIFFTKQSMHDSLKNILNQTLQFFKRLGFPILISGTLIYFLSHYDFRLLYTTEIQNSILYNIAGIISPLLSPIGLGSAVILTVLLFGLLGKEMIASTLAILGPTIVFTNSSAIAFLVFVMLYPTCINAFFATKRKVGLNFALTVTAINLTVAYLTAGLIYWIL